MGLKNNKSLGQNWLKNRAVLEEIAELAFSGPDRESATDGCADKTAEKTGVCVEIGPGLGYLTTSLLRRFDKVIAVEFDARLAANLPGSFPGKNLEVVNQDILKYDFESIAEPYVVAGNIPYYITSPIVRKVLTVTNRPRRVVLLVQKEVAERILDEKETVLSLFVKNYAGVTAGPVVPKEEFVPMPKVDSQVLVMEPHEPIVADEVWKLISSGFAAPRKKLVHNLASYGERESIEKIMLGCGVDDSARPGDLKLTDWAKLLQQLKKSD